MLSIIMKIYSKLSSKNYINYLRKQGAKIGEGTVVFYPRNVFIDNTRPWMIEIGKNVQITKNVSILTHDYSWSVLKGKYGEILGASGKVTIGDNVFIGFNTTILKGVTIGNNVIIGANSVVSKNIPSNCVACGNPAKVIMTLDEFKKRREDKQITEVCELINEYIKTYKKDPNDDVLREFMFLYKERNQQTLDNKVFQNIASLVNNYDETIKNFQKKSAKFKDIHELIEYAQTKQQ